MIVAEIIMVFINMKEFYMKKILLILLACTTVLCLDAQSKQPKDKTQRMKQQATDLCVDSLVYAQAGVSPWNGRYPLAKRLSQWQVEAYALSDEERQELIEPVQENIAHIFSCARSSGKLTTERQIADFTGAVEGVFCHLATYEHPLSQELLACNVALIKNHEQGPDRKK